MRELQLSNSDKVTLIDDGLYDFLSQFRWRFKNGYAVGNVNGSEIRLHRLIMGVTTHRDRKKVVDHVNRDRLDNRKENLRICTHCRNGQNKSVSCLSTTKVRGVTLRKDTGKYMVRIVKKGKRFTIGCFNTLKEAEKAQKKAAKRLYKEFS